MTHKEAWQMKMAIELLINLTKPDRYCVAVEDRYPESEDDATKYALHLYLRDPQKNGLVDMALLARAIEDMGTHFLTCDSHYDAGTKKGEDIRNSIQIW